MKRFFTRCFVALFLFVSIFSRVKMDVRAVPATQEKYQYITYDDKNNPKRIEGVYQGKEGDGDDKSGGVNFSQPAPLANIFIREADIDTPDARKGATAELKITQAAQRDERMKNLAPYFEIINDGNNKNLLFFNQAKAVSDHQADKDNYLLKMDDYNSFQGDIVSYTYKDAAELEDGSKADVVFTYSNLRIALQKNMEKDNLSKHKLYLFCGNEIHTGGDGAAGDESRYGIIVNVKIQVLQNDKPVSGTYYFRTRDIDIDRKNTGYQRQVYNAENENNYSESIEMTGGYVTTDGYSVYIPGWPNSSGGIPGDYGYGFNGGVGPGYKCNITKTGTTYRFDPGGKDGAFSDNGSFYSGFMAVVNNEEGLRLTVRSNGASTQQVRTYMFANYTGAQSDTRYQVKSSTGEGGNIETTVNGNASGKLDDVINPSEKKGPALLTVPTGKSMTYTMTPKPGYVIDKIFVDDDSLDYTQGGELATLPAITANGTYLYTFTGISNNKAIHVTWKRSYYTEYYEYENAATLPVEVRKTIPTRQDPYNNGAQVTAASPSATEVIVGNKKYTFNGWNNGTETVNNDDVRFIGSWTVEDIPPGTTPDPVTPTPTSAGGGSTPPPATPVPEDALPALQVPSTETSGGATADGGTGLTIEQGQASPLAITPVLPEGVVAGGFRRVEVNGVVQPAELYHVNGDTVTLFPALLNTLPVGTHTIRLVYDNLWTEAVATVLGATRARVMNSPPTGDGNTALIYALIGIQAASAGGVALLLKRRRRS